MEKGLSFTATMRVMAEVTAEYIGSGDLAVLATPAMCALMENAAMMAVATKLEEGQTTVGTALNIEHSRATKVGEIITATAVLTEVNGRELKFNIAARDEKGIIGEGTHTRFIVNREKFMAKLG
ncbi:MAG: thioesterase family protein [Alistipes sp.]|nr:thioesterase family protein [Alistipes sp.]